MKYLYQEITDFTATNLTETVTEWSSSTTYAVGDDVLVGTFIYRSLVASNLNYSPLDYLDIKWMKYAVSNKYAILDLQANTKSVVDAGNLTVTFTQYKMNTLAIGNYEADSILIEVLDELDVVLYSYEIESIVNNEVEDWWTYIYAPYDYEVNRATMVTLPIYGDRVKVTFIKSAESTRTACGYLIGGQPVDMGATLEGVNFSFNSFATKSFDSFGTLTLTKRSVQDLVDFNTIIPAVELQSKRRKIKEVYNDIICFIVDENEDSNYENLITLGVIQDASVVLSNPQISTISWSVLEVI